MRELDAVLARLGSQAPSMARTSVVERRNGFTRLLAFLDRD